ncbi:MAG TPA: hypothetical protein V6C63_09700 [Allocoleopsis sp.]
MSKDQVSVKLSPELRQHLKAYKAKLGKRSLKAAVVEILESHFSLTQLPNQPPAIDSSIGRIASLEAKVTYLSEQLEALKQAIATQPANEMAPSVAATTASATSQTPSGPATSTDEDDDIYDEPDEILYNFLEP